VIICDADVHDRVAGFVEFSIQPRTATATASWSRHGATPIVRRGASRSDASRSADLNERITGGPINEGFHTGSYGARSAITRSTDATQSSHCAGPHVSSGSCSQSPTDIHEIRRSITASDHPPRSPVADYGPRDGFPSDDIVADATTCRSAPSRRRSMVTFGRGVRCAYRAPASN
jgi:hypothetical protein